jgi:hypothetical protein
MDGQTDMTDLVVAFRNFANAAKERILGLAKSYVQMVLFCGTSLSK